MTTTLAEIESIWREIEAMLDESGGLITPEIDAKLEAFSLMEADKIDALGYVVTDLTGRAKATKEAVKQLAHRAATMEERAAWLERRVQAFADSRGLREVKGRVHTFGYKRHGGVAPLVIAEGADPNHSTLTRVSVEWDKPRIRKALEEANHPDHADAAVIAHIGERGESFRLK